jgi:hypothetical protein
VGVVAQHIADAREVLYLPQRDDGCRVHHLPQRCTSLAYKFECGHPHYHRIANTYGSFVFVLLYHNGVCQILGYLEICTRNASILQPEDVKSSRIIAIAYHQRFRGTCSFKVRDIEDCFVWV